MTPGRGGPPAGNPAATSDPLELAGGRLADVTLDTTLDGILRAHPDAVVLALDERADRVPLPADDRFAPCRELPVPGKTVMDFVGPQERMVVVGCWERARAVGLGQDRVRLSDSPDHPHTLTIIDARARHGVWIELLVPEVDGPAAPAPAVRLPPANRPRSAVVRKDLSAVIVAIDDRTTALLGWTADEMVGHRSLEFLHPDDHERAVGQWLEMRSHRATQRIRVRHRRRDDTWLWVEIENEYVGDSDPDRPDGVVAVARVTDVSEEMAAVEALRRQETLFRTLTESLPVGVVRIDRDRRAVYTNARIGALFGVGPAAGWSELVSGIEVGGRARLDRAVASALDGGPDDQLEAVVDLPGDPLSDEPRHRQYLFTLAGIPGPGAAAPDGVLVSVTDVTESVRLREKLRVRATFDPLTGCLNRSAVLGALEDVLGGPDAAGLAVVFLDLDGFKTVNDTAGHAVGDELLRRIGRRLVEGTRGADKVGRLGGDEFLVLCTGVADQDAAEGVADRLRDRLAAPVQLPVGRFRVRASFGVARARPGVSADVLVAQADRAMYRAKQAREASTVLLAPTTSI